jgi:tetratricopeptide (TPR) repeat protein
LDKKKLRAPRKGPPETPPPVVKPIRHSIDWRQHGLMALLLWAALLATYSNSFGTGLLYDNGPVILDDPRIRAVTPQNIDAIWSKGYWYNNQDPTLYRPLTTFSYLFNYAVLGSAANPTGYHWINLLMHGINVLLVYAFGLVIFQRKTIPAVALAALWGLHPILTESVTNIVGRADMLSGMGVLIALLCHIYAASASGLRRAAWLAGVLAGAAIAVYSKESGVVLIAILPLYDFLFRRSAIRSCLAGYGAALLSFAAFFYLRAGVLATLPASTPQFVNNPIVGASFLAGRLTAIQVIGRYIWLLVWPQTLSCDYAYNQIPIFRGTFQNWGDWATLLALAVCLGAAALAVIWHRRNPVVAFFIALFFIALSPGANIVLLLVTIMAERFLYLPSLGFAGCLVWALFAAAERWEVRWPRAKRDVLWVAGAICLAYVLRTHARNNDWDNEQALWDSAAKAAPNSYKGHMNLDTVSFRRGGRYLDLSIAEGEKALNILRGVAPGQDDALTYANVGAHHRVKGDEVKKAGGPDAEQKARYWYEKSLAILLHGEEVDRARSEDTERVNRAKGTQSEFLGVYQVYVELAQTYIRLGEEEKALQALDYGALLNPADDVLKLTSLAYLNLHRQDDAVIVLIEGVILHPDAKGFASEVVKLYEDRNPPTCAVEKVGNQTNLNFNCPLVQSNFCTAAARLQDYFTRRHQPADVERMRLLRTRSMGCPAQ